MEGRWQNLKDFKNLNMADKKQKKTKEPFYKMAVDLWFSFYKEKFIDAPTFDTSAPRDLKLILESLRKRAETQGQVWTEELCIQRLKHFLNFAYNDLWISQHFTLRILNSQKDCIYAKLRQFLIDNRERVDVHCR
jgi:dynactin complex subunit